MNGENQFVIEKCEINAISYGTRTLLELISILEKHLMNNT